MSLRIAVALTCGVAIVSLAPVSLAQSGGSALTPEAARYVSARRSGAKDDLKTVQKQLARARDYYRQHPVLDAYGRFLTAGEVSLLQHAESELAGELSRLDQIESLRRGRPMGSDSRANQAQWSTEAQQLHARLAAYEKELKSMRARLPDATRARREDEAYAVLTTALSRHRDTMEVWLAGVGAPSMTAAVADQQKRLAASDEAMRQWKEDQLRRRIEGDRAWREFGNIITGFAQKVVAEGRNVGTTDLGEGGDEAKRSGVFSPRGLRHGDLLHAILDGRDVIGDYRLGHMVPAYVVKFSQMCASALPADRVEITTTQVETLVGRNGYGVEISRQTFTGRPEATGIFATPAFGKAYIDRAGANPIAELGALAANPLAMMTMPIELRGDVRLLIARHGCTGPITRRFADNLLALVR